MKTIFFTVIIALSLNFTSCTFKESSKHSSKKIEYINPQITVFYDSIYTSFPGKIVITKDYVVWTEPKSAENFLHIIRKKDSKHISSYGNIGNGPYDFTTPDFGKGNQNEILVYDLNQNKKAEIQLDSLDCNANKGIVYEKIIPTKETLQMNKLSNGNEMVFSPCTSSPFGIIKGHHIYYSGKYPIEDPDISERSKFNYFQGKVAYNPFNEMLFYSTSNFRYTALYKRNDVKWELIKETKIPEYSVRNGELKFNKKIKGITEVALTKNYIVTAEYLDETITSKDLRLNNYILPEVLCVYDYNLELIKVLKVNKPILRIGGNHDSDDIFAIVEDPDFKIVSISH